MTMLDEIGFSTRMAGFSCKMLPDVRLIIRRQTLFINNNLK